MNNNTTQIKETSKMYDHETALRILEKYYGEYAYQNYLKYHNLTDPRN